MSPPPPNEWTDSNEQVPDSYTILRRSKLFGSTTKRTTSGSTCATNLGALSHAIHSKCSDPKFYSFSVIGESHLFVILYSIIGSTRVPRPNYSTRIKYPDTREKLMQKAAFSLGRHGYNFKATLMNLFCVFFSVGRTRWFFCDFFVHGLRREKNNWIVSGQPREPYANGATLAVSGARPDRALYSR